LRRFALRRPLAAVARLCAPLPKDSCDLGADLLVVHALSRVDLKQLHREFVERANRLLSAGFESALTLRAEVVTTSANVVGSRLEYGTFVLETVQHATEVVDEFLGVAASLEELQANEMVSAQPYVA